MDDTNNKKPNPFDPAALRLDQSFADTVGVKKHLVTVPVRKPNRQDFVRVHSRSRIPTDAGRHHRGQGRSRSLPRHAEYSAGTGG